MASCTMASPSMAFRLTQPDRSSGSSIASDRVSVSNSARVSASGGASVNSGTPARASDGARARSSTRAGDGSGAGIDTAPNKREDIQCPLERIG